MSWPRDVTVTVAGTDVSADALDAVTISNGARTWWEQTVGGYARFTLYDEDPGITLADQVTIDVDDQDGYPVRLFTGRVSAVDCILSLAGPFWTITATGPLSTAGRRVLTGPIAYGLDGDQIAALAIEALSTQWQAAPGDWNSQTLTWAQFAPDTSEIDQPGIYQLAAITETPANVLDQLELAARSGQGWLYETPDGVLGYGDSTRRELTPAGDFITIPGSAVLLTSVVAERTDGDLVNRAVVEWYGGEVIIDATTSQSIYGLYERTYETTLEDQTDASGYALRRVQLDGAPRITLPAGVQIDLRQLDADQLDNLIGIRRNYGVLIESIPTYLLPEGLLRGFVEGYVWRLGPITATLDLYASDYALSVFGLRWAATGSVTWDDVAATVTWADTEETL